MNPFFQYFNDHRQSPLRRLYNPRIARVKEYPGAEFFPLPKPEAIPQAFDMLIKARISETDFIDTSIGVSALSTILYWSAAELGERRDGQGNRTSKMQRPHPSGGAMYPIELYVVLDEAAGLPSAWYHYRPDRHGLELVRTLNNHEMLTFKNSFGYAYTRSARFFLMFSFVLERGAPKYSTFAYKLGLIEAGHIAQNIYLTAAANGVRCCAVGGFKESMMHDWLGLDGYNETLFHSLVLGKPRDGSVS